MRKFAGECGERLCGKNGYGGYRTRTNDSLVLFISNRKTGREGGGRGLKTTFANWNKFDQKKKKNTINYFYYSIPESDNNVIQRNYNVCLR